MRIKALISAVVLTLIASAFCACDFDVFHKTFDPVAFTDEEEKPLTSVLPEGTKIDGIDVSGMTIEEAKLASGDGRSIKLQEVVSIAIGDVTIQTNWLDLGLHFDDEEVCERTVMACFDIGPMIARFKAICDYEHDDKCMISNYHIDETITTEYVQNNLANIEGQTSRDASISIVDGKVAIIPEVNGITVDVERTVREIVNTVKKNGILADTKITAVGVETQAKVTAEQLSGIKDVLGTFSTEVSGNDNRVSNVTLGTSHINGLLLMPGETASASTLMTPRTKENGYKMAPQYVDGRSKDAYGGGICQVSSTLYNAVLMAELKVEERSPHSMNVKYVEPSRDAAISDGYKDMRFTNNLENPIYVFGEVKDRICTFTIFGTEYRDANRTVEYKSVVTSSYTPTKTVNDPSLPAGTTKSEGGGHKTIDSYLLKIVKVDGKEVSSEKLHSDHYSGNTVTIHVGTGPAATTAPQPTKPPTTKPIPPTTKEEPTKPSPTETHEEPTETETQGD